MEFFEAANKNLQRYHEQLRMVKVVMYMEFTARFKKAYDVETAKVLAGQVINYLTGEDVEQVCQNAQEPLKSKIGQIKDQVMDRADEVMQQDNQLREVIGYTVRMEEAVKLGELGEAYLTSSEKARIDGLLQRYGLGLTEEVTPSLYSLIITRFLQDKQHLFQN